MNKTEMIKAIAEQTGLTQVDVEKAINAEHAIIKETVKNGEDVKYVGFGTFKRAEQAAREVNVPTKPGEKKLVDAKFVPKFQSSKAWKDEVATVPFNK